MELTKKISTPLMIAGVIALAVASGTAISALQANAQSVDAASTTVTTPGATTTDSSGQPSAGPAGQTPPDPSKGGHVGSNGTKEELLTGDTAEKVKAAVMTTNPGITIERVENDAEGATYEAHIKKADGTRSTVKLDADFKVTSTEDGMR